MFRGREKRGQIKIFCEKSIFVTFEFLEWNSWTINIFLIIKESSKFCRKGLRKGRTD